MRYIRVFLVLYYLLKFCHCIVCIPSPRFCITTPFFLQKAKIFIHFTEFSIWVWGLGYGFELVIMRPPSVSRILSMDHTTEWVMYCSFGFGVLIFSNFSHWAPVKVSSKEINELFERIVLPLLMVHIFWENHKILQNHLLIFYAT